MPQVDMPLVELRHYQGMNPRPSDFDAFWDDALAEMRAVDPAVELAPAAFQAASADCYDMTFTGVKGARVYAKLLKPKKDASPLPAAGRPAVVQFHGYSGNCGDWSDKLNYVAEGFVVAALDCRGQSGRSEDVGGVKGNTYEGHIVRGLDGDPNNMLMRNVMLDTAQLAGLVIGMDDVDGARVSAIGGSQGGGLTLACAALEPRIRRLAPAYPFLCDYKRVWHMDLAKSAYDELAFYFRAFDPQHAREDEIFTKLGYVDAQHLAPRIKGETLMACGLMDEVCPPSTQFAAFNKINAKKDLVVYPDFGHEGLPGWNDISFAFITKP